MIVILDATGFRVKTSSSWYDIRSKRMYRRKDYDQLHIVIDARVEQCWISRSQGQIRMIPLN